MTAAVADPGLQELRRLGTPPSRRCPTPPSMKAFAGPDSGLVFGGRRVATPMGLSALWENWKDPKELVSHSLPAPPGPPGRTMQGQWLRGSGSPKKSGPLLIRAEAPASAQTAHTPRTRFDSPSPVSGDPRPVSTSRPSVTPSRLGFPDPKSPAPERAASPMVRHASPAPAAPAPAPAPAPVPTLPRRRDTAVSGDVRHKEVPLSREDLIHQHVLYVLRKNPDVARLRRVQQVTQGVYLIDGQEVNIEWRHSSEPGQRGWPIVVDGPMRQPLIDYLRDNEENKEFDLDTVVCTTALHQVPKNKRMTFDDKHKQYSRLEAMKVAKEQASIREQAADYTLDGKQVPDELVRRYNQALRTKVRSNRSKEDRVIIAQEKQDLAPLHSAQAKMEPVKSEKVEVAGLRAVPAVPPVRQSSPSPAAVRMAAQAMAVVKPEATPVLAVAVPSSESSHLTPFPAVSMINHRGISLNGVPSYVPTGSWQPPLRVTRSWSGAIEPDLSNASYRPVASVQLTPVAPQPVAQVVTSAPVVLARRQISVGHLPQTQLTGEVEANTPMPMTPGTPPPCLG
mmetsp:Transcript_25306/g.41072  ORF Transcript_25306/g.41072 Transcript_25306/m.41072 type:complete len:565 (-) Transcript_25306:89-1783(-)